jgi:hypothetical protein
MLRYAAFVDFPIVINEEFPEIKGKGNQRETYHQIFIIPEVFKAVRIVLCKGIFMAAFDFLTQIPKNN